MGKRFNGHCHAFRDHFLTRHPDYSTHARSYLQGLMQARRKNRERIAEVVPDSDEQSLHHFIRNVEWDTSAVMRPVAQQANDLLGAPLETALLIDESGFEKKGTHSVGVDGLYGNNPELLYDLDDLNETFMIDIHKDQRIYLNDPEPAIRQNKSTGKALQVKKLIQQKSVAQSARIAGLVKEIEELKSRLRKNSRNSSKPPS